MEVTKDNFDELLPEILEAIESCTFIALDGEMTGLHLTDEKENYFDSVERYRMVRQSATNFLLVPFGMVLFFYDATKDEFHHRAYNFYMFRRQVASPRPNVGFTREASSLEFLSSWGFDFNKLSYKGFPYLTPSLGQIMKENYDNMQISLAEENSTPCPVPENLKKFMEETQNQVRSLVSGDLKELLLEELSPFQRKLVFNNIKPKYNSLYFETIVREQAPPPPAVDSDLPMDSSISESDNETTSIITTAASGRRPPTPSGNRPTRVLRVVKMTEEERKARDDEKKRQVFETIDKGIDFSKVIRKISETGKVVVGHNMILDVAHSRLQFVSDLPEDLASFKTLVQTAFPNLVDTKLMCCTHPFRELFQSSVLADVLKRVQEEPFGLPEIKEIREGSLSYSLGDPKNHEAGYDAFITGVCFVRLCQYLGKLQGSDEKRVLPESPLVMPYLNKLYLMRMMDISGTDLTPSRDHVFQVTCPKEATNSIVSLFSPFGQIQVCWQDDNHLFVSLNDKDQAAFVMKNIEIDKSSNFRVVPFTQYQSSREKVKRPLQRDSPDRPPTRQKSISESGTTCTAASAKNQNPGGKNKKTHQKGSKWGGGGGGIVMAGSRQHNSASTSSSMSSSSEGSISPPLSGSESVHHQKKKRPKTETTSSTAVACNNNGKGKGAASSGGPATKKDSQQQSSKKSSSSSSSSAASKLHFDEPSTWDSSGRQHNSASTSSSMSSSSEGSVSPPLSGSESVHHQKKKRSKTESAASNPNEATCPVDDAPASGKKSSIASVSTSPKRMSNSPPCCSIPFLVEPAGNASQVRGQRTRMVPSKSIRFSARIAAAKRTTVTRCPEDSPPKTGNARLKAIPVPHGKKKRSNNKVLPPKTPDPTISSLLEMQKMTMEMQKMTADMQEKMMQMMDNMAGTLNRVNVNQGKMLKLLKKIDSRIS